MSFHLVAYCMANGDQLQLLTVNYTELPSLTVPKQFEVKDAPAA